LTHDAPLRVAAGVAYVKQHHDSIAALRRAVAALDVDALAALGIAVPALGSLVLGLALAAGEMDADTAYTLSALDELFQAEQWGHDYEAVDRRTGMQADIVLAAKYIDLTRGNQ
jgi:chaperone required for assembly of F1-ATPase